MADFLAPPFFADNRFAGSDEQTAGVAPTVFEVVARCHVRGAAPILELTLLDAALVTSILFLSIRGGGMARCISCT